ncbi:autotransporter outer membrane beta-barrel domain-containing protein [Cupriavidus pinatubonensis]|uniref:autotransporter outer membrane beta-barrel domain-containing protein n=1 Tax=Cupriavidus pinatubonensis TaxID=248026 RepID=UPI0015E39ACD|nr:autotransporter outer membrane beta-barrel domain-containing protein [Cupriavidus pinatubonensis]
MQKNKTKLQHRLVLRPMPRAIRAACHLAGSRHVLYLFVGGMFAGLVPEAEGQTPCATVGTGQVSATDTCTVPPSTVIGTTVANPVAVTGTGAPANVTGQALTLNLGVANAGGANAQGGASIQLTGGQVMTTSNTAATANGQTGLLASGALSAISANGTTITMTPAAGINLTAARAVDGGTVTLTDLAINIGSAGSGRNFNHGLVASGANSNVFATGVNVTALSNFSQAARAELAGTVTVTGGSLTATGTGSAATGPVAAAGAFSGGQLNIRGGTSLNGGAATEAYGLYVKDAGSAATVSDATIKTDVRAIGVLADAGATATLTNSTVQAGTARGVWAKGNATIGLINTNVTSQSYAVTSGEGGGITVNGGTLSGSGQVPTVSAGSTVGIATITTQNTAIVSNGSANAAGVYANTGSLITLNGGTVDTFGSLDRGQTPNALAAVNPGAQLIANDVSVRTHGERALGVAADDGGTITLNRTTVTTDSLRALGIYAGVDPTKPGAAAVIATASRVETSGQFAHGAQAQARTNLDIPATITLNDNSTVTTHGDGAVGLRAVLKGKIDATQSSVVTEGAAAHGMLALGEQSLVTLNGATVTAGGINAHGGIAQDGGIITGTNAAVTANGANAAALFVAGELSPSSAGFTSSTLRNTSGPTIAVGGNGTISLSGSTVSGSGEWLRVGTIADFPSLPAAEDPIARPQPLPPDDAVPLLATLALSPGVVAMKTPLATAGGAILDVSASTLTGAATTLPGSTSTVTARDGTVWNMTGNSNLTNLTNDASRILFSAPVAGAFKTLTVTRYTGANGGVVGLNTVLAADNSPSDTVVIDGGTAGGQTGLRITNAGGAGAVTTANGILVVNTTNGGATQPDAFRLDGRAVAGPYEYRLFRSSVDGTNADAWYLRSEKTPPPAPPAPPDPLYRPEVAAYLANQRLAGQMFVHSLHDRLGEPQYVEDQGFDHEEDKPRSGWLRVVGKWEGSHSKDGNFKVDTDSFLLHGGVELAKWKVAREEDRVHLGLMAGYGYARSNAEAAANPARAHGTVEGFSLGAYGTWYQNDEHKLGTYVDTWFQYGWFNNKVEGDQLPTVSYHAQGWAISGEVGYAMPTRYDWVIEPQAQLIYVSYGEDDITEPNGTHVSGADSNGLITRLGVRVHRTFIREDRRKLQPYVTLNWWHTSTDSNISFNQLPLGSLYPSNRYELKLGLNADLGKRWTGWANVAGAWGGQSYHQYAARVGVKYTW